MGCTLIKVQNTARIISTQSGDRTPVVNIQPRLILGECMPAAIPHGPIVRKIHNSNYTIEIRSGNGPFSVEGPVLP